jgi:hypothetical protein
MKLTGIGRIEGVQTDEEGQPRSINVSAVVAGTPVVITIDAGPGTCFMKALEQDKNVTVEVAQ